MFTGLIQGLGKIAFRSASALGIAPDSPLEAPQNGESIAVNGCCLTLEKVDASGNLVFHTLSETLSRTNLAQLPLGSRVNLERALLPTDRLGGHIVQGHVDANAKVKNFRELDDGDWELEVALPPVLAPEVILKGSIAIDGVSLTVSRLEADSFAVRLIPETRKRTALADRQNATVNLETDLIGKYLHHLLKPAPSPAGRPITMERLAEEGFL